MSEKFSLALWNFNAILFENDIRSLKVEIENLHILLYLITVEEVNNYIIFKICQDY